MNWAWELGVVKRSFLEVLLCTREGSGIVTMLWGLRTAVGWARKQWEPEGQRDCSAERVRH